jgi:hypothetical protein
MVRVVSRRAFTFFTFAILTILVEPRELISQSPASTTPRVELSAAPHLRFTGDVDSNSPAVWQRVGGLNQLLILTSVAGRPSLATGPQLERLSVALPVIVNPWPGEGVWMEATIADTDGTLYGYFHNENSATVCPGSGKVIPRIGAARSDDHGLTWTPLGLVLEAPFGSHDCETNDLYFVGGVGDFSVQLDDDSRDLYIFYSQYSRRTQGVGVARLAWADRDNPAGKAMVFANGVWLPARALTLMGGTVRWLFPSTVPFFPAREPWNDDDTDVDAFWGPSVHWNVHLEQYVMLLNRAKDTNWKQEGIYVSFNRRLDNPTGWSPPVKILNSGRWYPQVMGIEVGAGTDKVAGRWARFFMGGSSDHLIQFIK